MSISSALSNALSGLNASSRTTEVISNNLANALTPGYAPREVMLSARGEGRGGGVMVDGVTRSEDPGLLTERRQADGELAHANTRSDFLTRLEKVTGTPDQPDSLSGLYAAFSASLVTAAAKPEEDTRLQAAVTAAKDLATKINGVSQQIQKSRSQAESAINQTVDVANKLLQEIATLNARIVGAKSGGQPSASYQDQRRTVIDQLAELVPVKLAKRENGSVALFTPGGASLLDGRPATLSFNSANLVTANMSVENGSLDGLNINGKPVITSGERSPIAGGRLAALFEVRDNLAPDAQKQLDAIARDLVQRFQDPGLDATRATGSAGLFTDAGLPFDVANETGLAGRLAINSVVDASAGGGYWRLRDGLGATAPGPVGNGALLNDLTNALERNSSLASGSLGGTPRSAPEHAAAFASHVAQGRLALDREISLSSARQETLAKAELSQGVDSDAEMQKMLLVEQAYSANARVIQTINDMLDTLMRI